MEQVSDNPEIILGNITEDVIRLLSGAEAVFDGTRYNMWVELPVDETTITAAYSRHQDGKLHYSIAKRKDPDGDGFIESWQYSWGDSLEPKLCYSRTHESRIVLSSIHEDDDHVIAPLGIDDYAKIRELIDEFKDKKGTK